MSDTTPDPAEIEATGVETIPRSFGEETYELPASSDDWPFRIAKSLAANDAFEFLSVVLGPEDFRRFMKPDPRLGPVRIFVENYFKAIGFNQGE